MFEVGIDVELYEGVFFFFFLPKIVPESSCDTDSQFLSSQSPSGKGMLQMSHACVYFIM